MLRIFVNNLFFWIKQDSSILEALSFLGLKVPRFCYHEALSIAGNCRICLVEVHFSLKPIASCAQPILHNLQIFTNTVKILKARESVMEALLLNHPLDCPICDQAGECDLQDQSLIFGSILSRHIFEKRTVENKVIDPFIKTIMTRCIHCTRCVRFASEITNRAFLGTLNRGRNTEIGSYISYFIDSSEISGNVIDLCPVGALTAKPYTYKARPWELQTIETIDFTDGFGSSVYVNSKETEIVSILPKNDASLNNIWLSNKGRFSYDSIQKNRLFCSYFLNKNSIQKCERQVLIDSLNNNSNNKKLFLINEEIDFGTLKNLKRSANTWASSVMVYNVSNFHYQSNCYYSYSDSFIKIDQMNFDNIVLVATNIQIEAAILNIKLRISSKQRNVNSLSFGYSQNSINSLKFLNISLPTIINILELKEVFLSKIIFNALNVFIIGESLLKRFYISKFEISNYFKIFGFNNLVYFINKKCNSEVVHLLNIKPIFTRSLLKSNCFTFFCSLVDSFIIRKIKLLLDIKKIVWVNSHGSKLVLTSGYTIPILTYYEQEAIFLNIEKRPQKSNNIFYTNGLSVVTLYNLLNSFLPIQKLDNSSAVFTYITEYIDNPQLFINFQFRFVIFFIKQLESRVFFSTYPFKYLITDFYLYNGYTTFSLNMLNCSSKRENNFTVFYDLIN